MSIIYPKKAKIQWHLRELIRRDYQNGKSSVTIGKKYEVSHKTALKQWKAENIENRSSAPIMPFRKYWVDLLYIIHYLYSKEKYNWDQITDYFEDIWKKVPRTVVYYYIKEWWLSKKRKEANKRINGIFKKYDPWYIHIDITYWPYLDWKKWYLHVAIDRATRLMYFELHDNKRAETAAKFLEKVISFFPFEITKVLTDNWKEYTLKNHLWKIDLKGAFDLICEEYNVEHRTTNPYTPQTNWMAEKVNDTIKSNTLKKEIYKDVNEMKTSLMLFLVYYNIDRRHGSLRGEIWVKTPYNALEYWYNIKPEIFYEDLLDFKEKLLTIKNNL